MNKSKFLKKSLAAILSVLLVVAMIPLSAAAKVWPENPVPNMTRLYIGNSTSQNGVKVENGVFKADISEEATDIYLRVDDTSLGTANVNQAELQVLNYQSVKVATVGTTAVQIAFDDVAEDPTADEITMDLRLVSTANSESYEEFKVVLTRVGVGTTAEIESATPIQSTGMFTAVPGENVINVQVARLAGENGSSTNPSVTLKAKDNAVIAKGTGNLDYASGTAANTVTFKEVRDGDTFTITSQSGNNTSEWTFKVTDVDALDTISVNGVAGVISDSLKNTTTDKSTLNTTTDYSPGEAKDGIADTVTVSLDSSVFVDRLGNAITANGTNTKSLPVSLAVKGNVPYVYLNSSKDATSYDYSTGGATNKKVNSGDSFDFVVPSSATATELSMWVPSGAWGNTAATTDYQKYILVIELKKSNNTAIESVIINEQVATIDGDTIHAVLPVTKADGSTPNTVTAIDEIKIVTDSSVASINLDDNDGTNNFFGSAADNTPVAGKKTWSARLANTSKANLSKSKGAILTVTAQNGDIQQYVISAEIDTDRTLAKLDALTLVAPDGTRYDGAISGHKISFKDIPYMTTSLSGWKLFATPNTSATAIIDDTAVINGTTLGSALFTDGTLAQAPDKRTRTYPADETIIAKNKNDNKVFTEYKVELSLAAPKTGNTLNSMTVTAQTTAPVVNTTINNVVYDRITTANTIKATIEKDKTGNTGKITLAQPFSLSTSNTDPSAAAIYDIITEITTNNGGVAFLGNLDVATAGSEAVRIDDGIDTPLNVKGGKISTLANNDKKFSSTYFDIQNGYFKTNKTVKIVVLPEEIARQVIADPYAGASGAGVNYIANGNAAGNRLSYGTMYSIEEKVLDPEHNANLKSIAVGDTTLTISGDKITGTLPYSLTTEKAGTVAGTSSANAKWVKFETQSAFAKWFNANSEGKVNGVAADPSATNLKFIFARNADHTVSVYTYDNATVAALEGAYGNPPVANTPNAFKVEAEDRLAGGDTSVRNYKFDLKWADPNTEAKIEKFSVAGRTGTISGQNVNVSVPYKTDVRGLIPTFTLSSGATMKLDDASNNPVESEKTTLDFSNPVKVIVTSEDGQHTEHYTITVTEGEMFSDVHESDWFYEVVIEAAQKGWINGDGNGHFEPKKTMDRAEFAQVIANMYKDEVEKGDYSSSRFPDVPSDHWASKAIAFCADRGYILGDSKGNFNPGDSITREQAAVILCRMKDLDTTAGRTTFADDASIADWAVESVNAVVKANYFQGVGNNQFDPKRPMMKCEGAAILVRSATK